MSDSLSPFSQALQITAEAVVIRNGQVLVEDLPDVTNTED